MIGVKVLAANEGSADCRWRGGLSNGVFGVALFLVSIFGVAPAFSQGVEALTAVSGSDLSQSTKPGEQMLVESDELVYDYDNNTVAAVGNVRIYYGGYTLEAEKVTYLRTPGRLIATGHVKFTAPDGVSYYSEHFDITDNFADGFVESLRVETVERTFFAAARAEREGGDKTTFHKGVYTACEPCKDNPEKPPLWQVKAAKIIVDQKEKMIHFEKASFEFAGIPIAWLPYFSTADPSVKRKSGLLTPTIGYSETLGGIVEAPIFWALAPNYDITFTPTALTRQGLLAEFEWRHRMQNGQYSLRMAGIHQEDSAAFLSGSSGTYAQRDWRGGIRTTGEFDYNEYWSYGWDVTAQSDRTFTRNYGVLSEGTSQFATSSVHLTGMSDRNSFDSRGYYFQVLTDDPDNKKYDQGRQPIAGVTDHSYTFDNPVAGGELSVTSNITKVYREKEDPFSKTTVGVYGAETIDDVQYYRGLGGLAARASTEIEWQRQFIGPMGQVITPFASVRADAFALDIDSPSSISGAGSEVGVTGDDFAFRAVPAVGFDWSLPVMATAPNSTHVFEPMVQVIARPDSPYTDNVPNEDAQSLVFDDSILFDRDKYSGFDLVETGVRANVGLRYRGTFDNGASVEGLIGQSFHLAGDNPFAMPDVAHTGLASGLETDRSDYVASLAVDTGVGPRLDFRGRFDQDTFEIQRGEIEATNAIGPLTASASYLYLREFPNDPDAETPISVVRGAASLNFSENWRAFGSVAYDVNNGVIASNSIGLAFDHDSCGTFSIAYSETREDYSDVVASRQINFLLQLRTLGEATYRTDVTGLVSDR